MPITPPSLRRARGFTIIEVLVVIGIIAILLTLLLTMTGRIKERSQTITCQAKLRQLYLANIQYSNDNDGQLLAGSLIGEGPTGNGRFVCWAMDDTGIIDFKVGTIWPYMPPSLDDRRRAVLCPSDSGEMARVGATQYAGRNSSYSFNAGIRPGSFSAFATLKLTDVAQPGKRVMIYEEFGPNDGSCFGPGDGDDWLTGRHGGENSTVSENRANYTDAKWREIGQGNVCYFDGRVELMTVAHYFYDTTHYAPLKQ